jgi:hypothetical protein
MPVCFNGDHKLTERLNDLYEKFYHADFRDDVADFCFM